MRSKFEVSYSTALPAQHCCAVFIFIPTIKVHIDKRGLPGNVQYIYTFVLYRGVL